MIELIPLANIGDTDAGQRPQGRRNRSKQKTRPANETDVVTSQIKTFRQAAAQDGFEDLIACCGQHRIVLTTESVYFVDPTMNDVIDGTFRVFGKVTRVAGSSDDTGVSLLRRSPLSKFGELSTLLESSFAQLGQVGFTGQKIEIEIPPPTMQVIPIAIFA